MAASGHFRHQPAGALLGENDATDAGIRTNKKLIYIGPAHPNYLIICMSWPLLQSGHSILYKHEQARVLAGTCGSI